MNVTKQQIQSGIVRFMENDVVKVIHDKPVMMAAAVIASLVKNSDSTIDKALDNPLIAVLLSKGDDGTYNLDALFDAITDTINRYGNFELRIPLLRQPFIFNVNDFRNLKSYIEGGDNDVREGDEPVLR